MVVSTRVLLSFVVLLINFIIYSGQECLWNLNKDLPINDPIYLINGTTELLIPSETGLKFATNESITLLCPGKFNTLIGNDLHEINVTCIDNNQILYKGKSYTLNALSCASPSNSDLIFTGAVCANGKGEILKIGFTSLKGFVSLIDVCYNRLNEYTFYSKHTLHGIAISGAQIESNRPTFRVNGLTNGTNTANRYKQAEQLERFDTLLGSKKAAEYINATSFLSRGHLAPDGDFLFKTWSFATYYFVNVAPEWQKVNAGNWLKVENLARDLAFKMKKDLTIYTGTHGVLQLHNASNVLTSMYLLDDLQLKVPKWYWKIIYSPSTSQGIALITLNNPHATKVTKSDFLCKNICAETKWQRVEWKQLDKGYTHCCNVNDLLKTIDSLSKMNITSNLTGNEIYSKRSRSVKHKRSKKSKGSKKV